MRRLFSIHSRTLACRSGGCKQPRAAIVLLCLVRSGALAQEATFSNFDMARGSLPVGFQVSSLSAYAGGFMATVPTTSAGEKTSPLINGGMAAEFGWYKPGPKVEAFARYDVTYDSNTLYPALNGFSHFLSLGVHAKLAPHVYLTLFGSGDSSIYSAFVFEPTTTLASVESSSTAEQLASGLSDKTAGSTGASALDFAVLGTKRMEAGSGMSVTFAQSDRKSVV